MISKYKQLTQELLIRKLSDFLTSRFARFKTPFQHVLLNLKAENLLPEEIIALELFGKSGQYTVKDYIDLVSYLELYELDSFCLKNAKRYFPIAEAINADAIEVVRQGRLLRDDYNFVIIDNPDIPLYCENRYCEHFDLFPALFNNLAREAVLIMNVVLSTEEVIKKYPTLDYSEWLNRRAAFYGLDIDEVKKLTPLRLISIYTKYFNEYGKVNYANVVLRRDTTIAFLVLGLEKKE